MRDIAVAAQHFHTNFDRWPRSLLELRNNLKEPFLGPRVDYWKRGYIFVPPTDGKAGRIATYGEDGTPSGRRDDGDAAFEFDDERAEPAPPLPTTKMQYL